MRYLLECAFSLAWSALAYGAVGSRMRRFAALAAFVLAEAIFAAMHHPQVLAASTEPPVFASDVHSVACTQAGTLQPLPAVGSLDLAAPRAADNAFVVDGWAIQTAPDAPADGVCMLIDGKSIEQTADYGAARPDVARALKNAELSASGFHAEASLARLTPGRHRLNIAVLVDGNRYRLLAAERVVTVAAAADARAPRR